MSSCVIERVRDEVAGFARDLDPACLTTADAARLLRQVVAVERQLAAVKLRLAHRAEEAAEWKAKGFRSPEEWLASVNGTGLGPATRMFATARHLEALPTTAEALAAGDVSPEQAAEVAHAAAIDPTAENHLLDVARRDGLPGVRREAERVKAAALDDTERHARIHRNRHLRRRTGGDGSFQFFGQTTADVGAAIWTALTKEANRIFAQARTAGRRDPADAYMLDALASLLLGAQHNTPDTPDTAGPTRPPARPDRTIFVRADLAPIDRGHTESGEICEVVGGGPVPPALVRSWLPEADLRLLYMSGTDVQRVVHLGRTVTEAQRTALYERAQFRCENAGCPVTHGLEIDHLTEWRLTRHTTLDELLLLCSHHHDLKTYKSYTVSGPPGHRKLIPPPPPP